MGAFFDWFFAFLTTMINGVWKIVSGIGAGIAQIFDVGSYVDQFITYKDGFEVTDWIFAIVSIILVIAIWAIVFYLIVIWVRKYIRFRRSIVQNEQLLEELAVLHKDVIKLTKERERILALRMGSNVTPEELRAIFEEVNDEVKEQDSETTEETKEEIHYDPRFVRLNAVDRKYSYYIAPEYREDFTLEQICNDFRNFACSRMGLFYEEKIIRLFFAGMAASKLIILQGISGTGKTSLPYAFGKFIKTDSTIVSVQPSWRDRTELFGYFNEFSKKFNETEVLRRIYESSMNDDLNMLILDEMNIARVEYYFAEMLSIMEMPDTSEWKIELVPSSWDNDPVNLQGGLLTIPQNTWYIGTANNDDTTFSISDKVYDRAITINIDTKGVAFEAPDTEGSLISYTYLNKLYKEALIEHQLEQKYLNDIEKLDEYVIKKFRVAFGNRIVKQLKTFVPVYVACGGTVLEGIDHILATKVFRKFEMLNLALIRDEIKGLINYMELLFGKNTMVQSVEFLERLKKSY